MKCLPILLAFAFLTLACASTSEEAGRHQLLVESLEQRLLGEQDPTDLPAIEADAASPENEFTELTIESVYCSRPGSGCATCMAAQERRPPCCQYLWCRLREWRSYGKLLRFSRLADPVFYLDAPAHPRLEGTMVNGALGFGDDTRSAIIIVPGRMAPGGEYRLRPRSANSGYRWSVASDVVVVVK